MSYDTRALEWSGGQRCLELFSRIDEKAGIWNNSLEQTLTSVTGGAYKASDGALTSGPWGTPFLLRGRQQSL